MAGDDTKGTSLRSGALEATAGDVSIGRSTAPTDATVRGPHDATIAGEWVPPRRSSMPETADSRASSMRGGTVRDETVRGPHDATIAGEWVPPPRSTTQETASSHASRSGTLRDETVRGPHDATVTGEWVPPRRSSVPETASSRASVSMRGGTLRDETVRGPHDATVSGEWVPPPRSVQETASSHASRGGTLRDETVRGPHDATVSGEWVPETAGSRASVSMRGGTVRDETVRGPHDATIAGEWVPPPRSTTQETASSHASMRGGTLRDETVRGPHDATVSGEWVPPPPTSLQETTSSRASGSVPGGTLRDETVRGPHDATVAREWVPPPRSSMQDAASSRASLSMRGETLRDETMQGPYDETVTGEWALASRAPPSAEPEGRFEGIPLTQFLPKTERAPACESADSRQSSVASGSVGTPCGLGLTTAQSCLVGGSRAPSLSHRLSARCSSDLAASLSFRSGSAAAKQARLELSQARSPRAIASALSQYKGVVRTRSEIPAAFRKTASEATQQPPSATMLPFAKSISVGSLTSHGSAASSAAASDAGGAEGKGSKRAGSILAQLGQLKDLKALLAEREDEILDCVALGETLLGEVASLRAGTDAYAPCAAELTPILQRLHGYLSDSAGDRANLAGEKRTLLNTVETVQGLVDEAVELAASEGYVPAAAAAAAGRGEGEEEEEAPAPAELVAGLVRICGHLHADMRNKEGDARTARRQSVCYTDRVATARALEELEETRTLLERKESDLRKQKEDLSWCQRETLKYTEGEIAAYALQLEAAQDALRADRRAAEEASEAASRAALRGAHADALGDAALRALAEAAAVASGLAAELSSARSAAEKAEAAEARAAALQAEAEELRGCLGGAEERTRALEVENGLCADRLSQLGTALHAAMDAAETAELGRQALEVSKREGADLRAENEALRAAAGVAGAAEAEATRLAGELQQRLESQQATFSSLEEARQGWEAACDEAAALRAALEEAEAVGAEEAAARGAAAAEHERLVRQVEAEVAELERQLGDLASGGQAAEAEAARLRAALAEAEAEAAQAAAAAASLEAAQQKEAEEAELVVDELRAINAAYKTRLAELGEEHRVAEGKLGELCAVLSGCDGLLVESYTPSVLADATPARVAELLCRVARGRGEADARARALEDRLSATQAELAAAQEAAEAAAARGRVLEMDAGREAQRAERLAARVAQEACDAEELQRLRCGEETLQAALAAQAGVVDGLERRVAEVEGGRDEAARLLEERTTQAAAEEAAGRALSARLLEDEVNVELLAERLQSTQGLLEQRDAEAFNLQGRLDAVQAELEGLAVRYEQVTLKTAEEEAARAEERKELEGLRERVAQAERMDKAAQEDPIVDKMMRRAEAMRAMEVTRHCYAERLEVYQASVSSLMELNEREPADVLASPAGAAVSARRTTRLTGGSLSEDAGASAMHERFSRLQSKLERLDMDLQDSQQCHKKAESEMQRTSEVLRESAARTHKQLQSASSSAHRPYATRLLSGKV